MLLEGSDAKIGVHGGTKTVLDSDQRLIPLQRHLAGEGDCRAVVEEFVARTTPGVPLVAGLAKTASVNHTGETDVLTSFLLSNDVP